MMVICENLSKIGIFVDLDVLCGTWSFATCKHLWTKYLSVLLLYTICLKSPVGVWVSFL